METRHYHAPPTPVSTRPRCPVCGTTVYSPAGIHPQCAVRQADPPRPKVKPATADSPAEPAAGVVETPGAGVASIGSHPPTRSHTA